MDEKAFSFINSLAAGSSQNKTEDVWYCIAVCNLPLLKMGIYSRKIIGMYLYSVQSGQIRRRYLPSSYQTIPNRHRKTQTHSAKNQRFYYNKTQNNCGTSNLRLIESLLKTGIIYGIPRLINAFRFLTTAIPSPDSNEISSIRNHIATPSSTDERGLDYMRNIFRSDLDPFLSTMDQYWPDLRTLVVTNIYGYYQSEVSIVDAVTTSQLNIATLIPMDVPGEVGWHMRGLMRNGGSEEQLEFALKVTMEVVAICEVRLKNEMPRAEDVVNEERLF
jgi:hypothetical protein